MNWKQLFLAVLLFVLSCSEYNNPARPQAATTNYYDEFSRWTSGDLPELQASGKITLQLDNIDSLSCPSGKINLSGIWQKEIDDWVMFSCWSGCRETVFEEEFSRVELTVNTVYDSLFITADSTKSNIFSFRRTITLHNNGSKMVAYDKGLNRLEEEYSPEELTIVPLVAKETTGIFSVRPIQKEGEPSHIVDIVIETYATIFFFDEEYHIDNNRKFLWGITVGIIDDYLMIDVDDYFWYVGYVLDSYHKTITPYNRI